MDLILTILVGGLVGWMVSAVTNASRRMNILTAVATGMVGALLAVTSLRSITAQTQGAAVSQLVGAAGAAIGVTMLRWLSSPVATPHQQRRAKR
jgi:uncharacterized membrane protein YeaQ/YmgE (transglycosylase-associated protein family)